LEVSWTRFYRFVLKRKNKHNFGDSENRIEVTRDRVRWKDKQRVKHAPEKKVRVRRGGMGNVVRDL